MIVFEGIDGSGKTTQAKRVAELLSLPYVKFPDYERMPLIRDFLQGKIKLKEESAFLLFLADIIEGAEEKAVVDRYVFSTIAYAVALPLKDAMAVVEALPFKKPKLTLYFDVDPVLGVERKANQGVEFSIREKSEYLEKVRGRYLEMLKKGFFSERWELIDASAPLEEVSARVEEVVKVAT